MRAGGAVPATIGVLDGEIVVGLTAEELQRFGADARKLGPRDLAAAVTQRAIGATTVGGTLAVCRSVGIKVMATGGLGGVHRGWPTPPDVSADLQALASTQVLVVSSGVKSLLDVPATAELSRRSACRCSATGPTICRSSTRLMAARRSPPGSRAPPRPPRSRGPTGRSAAAGCWSAGRPTTAWTTRSR